MTGLDKLGKSPTLQLGPNHVAIKAGAKAPIADGSSRVNSAFSSREIDQLERVMRFIGGHFRVTGRITISESSGTGIRYRSDLRHRMAIAPDCRSKELEDFLAGKKSNRR